MMFIAKNVIIVGTEISEEEFYEKGTRTSKWMTNMCTQDIREQQTLDKIEQTLTGRRILELIKKTLSGNFDLDHL